MNLKLGCSDPQIVAIQTILSSLGFMFREPDGKSSALIADGAFDSKTEQAVMNFQKNQCLLVDGIVGPVTMKALQDAYMRRMLEQTAPTALLAQGGNTPTGLPRLPLVRVPADKYGDGYGSLYLRSDAAQAWNTAREKLVDYGCKLTSSGGIRELSEGAGPNRSLVSFHYVGLAFDLYINSGMRDPDKDPYVVTQDGDKRSGDRPYLRVWARCATDKPPKNKDLEIVTRLDSVITYKKRDASLPSVKGSFIDLTTLLEGLGFARIKPRPAFWSGESELAAEWWHFQFEKPLLPRVSTFGEELLHIYTRSQVEGSAPWTQRDRIFQVDWF